MKRLFRSWLPLLFCAACGGHEVDISTITNETAKQAATEVEEEAEAIKKSDSIPAAVLDTVTSSQQKRKEFIQEGLAGSPYARLSDHGLDSLRQAWLLGYARSCDAADLQRIMDAMRSDEVLKQWAAQDLDSATAYHQRLMAAKRNCAGS